MRRAWPVLILPAALALWWLRPLWHWFAMFLWTAPLVWVPSLLMLLAGLELLRRSPHGLRWIRAGARPPWRLFILPAAALVAFVLLIVLNGGLVNRAIVEATTYEPIATLPSGGQVRLVPRVVAERNAASAFNSPTETLTDFRIVSTAQGPRWTALRSPEGFFRRFRRNTAGIVELDAGSTSRSLRQVDARFETAPRMHLTDNLRWRLLKKRFLIRLQNAVGIATPQGPRLVVPYLEYKGVVVRRPVLGGVFVVAPDGTIEDLEPGEAARRPELARSGRLFPDTLARRLHDAYGYERGLRNAWFVHEDQTQISDTEANPQPYLIDFGGELGPQWVSVAEPYGRAFAARAIFLTDAVSGRTRIWRVPRGRALSGNRRAIDAVRAVSIPGIDFGSDRGAAGNFVVVEPRPVFVRGRLVYLTSVIPQTANTVSKTVVVDAESNKVAAIFDNDRDPRADERIRRYLASGARPGEPAPEPDGARDPEQRTERDLERELDDIARRQRELLEEIERLRDEVREGRR